MNRAVRYVLAGVLLLGAACSKTDESPTISMGTNT